MGILVTSLALLGIVGTLSLGFRRVGRRKAQEKARQRAEMIRQRLRDEDRIVRRPVQIRVGH